MKDQLSSDLSVLWLAFSVCCIQLQPKLLKHYIFQLQILSNLSEAEM